MIIDTRPQYDFDDVMFLPQVTDPSKGVTSRSDVNVNRTFKPGKNRPEWSGVPIIAANMDTIGTFAMAEELIKHGCCTALHKHYSVEELGEFFKKHEENKHLLFYTMGISDSCQLKFAEFVRNYGYPSNICIDVANGYLSKLQKVVEHVRLICEDSIIMAGNVVTGDAVYALIQAGASIVKVGIGSGSACTTRRLTGVGRPQLSAIIECANAAHGMNALICADGGCVHPSHVSKAIGAGADFVMLGGMLSGHAECGGKEITEEVPVMVKEYYSPVNHPFTEINYGKTYPEDETTREVLSRMVQDGEYYTMAGLKHMREFVGKTEEKIISIEFYGMSSDTAMDKHNGGMASYRSSEGRTLQIPYKGVVSDTIEYILGGIRSTMTYIGAKELKEISKCATFIPVNNQLNTSLSKHES
jgi:GMP reductase